jgi:hypothetical protein
MILPGASALAFVPLFAFCDREVGNGGEGAVGRSTAMALAIVLGGLIGVLTLGPWFAIIGALWAAARSIGFADGELDPTTPHAIAHCALRYLLWTPAVVLLAYWSHGNYSLAATLMTVAAVFVMGMRVRFGQMTKKARATGQPIKGDPEANIELIGGGLFGLAIAAYAIL